MWEGETLQLLFIRILKDLKKRFWKGHRKKYKMDNIDQLVILKNLQTRIILDRNSQNIKSNAGIKLRRIFFEEIFSSEHLSVLKIKKYI